MGLWCKLIHISKSYRPTLSCIFKFKFNRYGGYETKIIDSIASKLNFEYTISPPKSAEGDHLCRCWGDQVGKDNYTGLIGDLYNGWCDIGWANLFDTEMHRNTADLSVPYTVDRACFIVRWLFSNLNCKISYINEYCRWKNQAHCQNSWYWCSHLGEMFGQASFQQ